ncbi:hypothetical protein SBA6_780002 [Candidatus Sulfopaludibacter sp. SbA6]|nr:hypothetical protein SBA6_780002 [Candidatus Sulfopaludibacter sp. SbA6]
MSLKFANSPLFNVRYLRRDTTCVAPKRSLYAPPPIPNRSLHHQSHIRILPRSGEQNTRFFHIPTH